MFKNFENFIFSSADNFPVRDCTIPAEYGVFNSDAVYQILYIDIRFPCEKMVAFARPYICKDDAGNTTFGWLCSDDERMIGNVEKSDSLWDEFAVGFIPVDKEYMEKDNATFNQFKAIVDAQLNQ